MSLESTSPKKNKITYADAGVDIDAGNNFVDEIKSITKETARQGATGLLGGFGGIFDLAQLSYSDPLLVGTTDGVGTKLLLAQKVKNHYTVGMDLVAMCVNDLVVQGGEPLFFLDYIATGALHFDELKQLVAGIAYGCKQSGCALIGGETAEMPGMYKPNTYDIAGFAVGIVERDQLLPKQESIKAGDVVVGIASSGIHANGFSLVRQLLETHNISINQKPPFLSKHETLIDELLEPTKIYVKSLLPLMKKGFIKAAAHITGGGLIDNVPRVLPEYTDVELDITSWKKPAVFEWIAQLANLDTAEMMRTFNWGIGMVLIVEDEHLSEVQSFLKQSGEEVYCIGKTISTKEKKPHIIYHKRGIKNVG